VRGELERLRTVGRWFAAVRVAAVPVALAEVALTDSFPAGYRTWAWVTCGVLAVGALLIAWITFRELSLAARQRVAETALVFDTAVVFAFIFLYSYRNGQPTWTLFYVPVIEGALRFGLIGGLGVPLATTPLLVAAESWRSRHFEPRHFHLDLIGTRVVVGVAIGAVIGRLVALLTSATRHSEGRAAEAERLRDELGRRADVLEAATRCARALSSSLEIDRAFEAFIRELRGLIAFDRTAIVLVEGGAAQVMAVAGVGADDVFRPGSHRPVAGSLLEEVLQRAQPVYRRDMSDQKYPEEHEFLEVGLRCRLAAPLLQGPRPIGMLSVVRREPDAFAPQDIELLALLGRLVGSAVQNIRSYDAERKTVEELRRLSALRADFVSLVSHELRTPMASVIGSARTLQQRWRELAPEQREAFLALIADETNRLAALIGDVLDTSRIDAGTFSYSFSDVDVGELVRESAASADISQDEVHVTAAVTDDLVRVRGDRDRLRQVLTNLIDNAIKYSPAGSDVAVRAYRTDARLVVEVADRGPGIAKEQQRVIFEKFGRAVAGGDGKPGTGLGLFIARSIVEAHGGVLDVRSAPEQGATFVVELPLGGSAA
jgi:signal transduction histidine kinase